MSSAKRYRRTSIPGLHETITRLSALRRGLSVSLDEDTDGRLKEFTGFGSNPGDLLARYYIPEGVGTGAPLVVVLHGCTQTASSYNRGAGWTTAADEHGFALLFPEQQRSNNPNLCFNWFSTADVARGRGEALSIVQMVEAICSRHGLDKARVYITGLSAGGAMTAAMLATYPDVFAGGAVIAGLPFGTATSVQEAFERMRGQFQFDGEQLANLVRSASAHHGRWPTLSVWHGSGDRTVDVSNASALVEQWRGLNDIAAGPSAKESVGAVQRRVWRDREGIEVIEEIIISNMGHGTPVDPTPANRGEAAGPYMLDVGVSSTRQIVRFWSLDRGSTVGQKSTSAPERSRFEVEDLPQQSGPAAQASRSGTSEVQSIIERALKSAGLMK